MRMYVYLCVLGFVCILQVYQPNMEQRYLPPPVFNKPENNSPKPISLYNLWINFQFYTRFHHRLTRKFSW